MRYLLYIYTGKDYGVTDLAELLDLFNTSTFSSASGLSALKGFIHYFEGTPPENRR